MKQEQPDSGTGDAYETLQISPQADQEVIEAAYRVLARRYHPDRNPSPDATALMSQINAAWETLRDPERRAAYDRTRLGAASTAAQPPAESRAPAASGPVLVVEPARLVLGPRRQGARLFLTAGVYTEPPGIRVAVTVAEGSGWLAVRPAMLTGLDQDRITVDVRTLPLRQGRHQGAIELTTSWERRRLPVDVEVVATPFLLRFAALVRHGPSGGGWRSSSIVLALSSAALVAIITGLIVLAVGR